MTSHENSAFVSQTLIKLIQRLEGSTLQELYTKLPKEKGMTYVEYLIQTLRLSFKMAKGSLYLLIHSFFPFIFEEKGREKIEQIYHELCPKKKE